MKNNDGIILLGIIFLIFIIGYGWGINLNKPTTAPKTAVDIVNYTCTTFDDLTMKCEVNGRG